MGGQYTKSHICHKLSQITAPEETKHKSLVMEIKHMKPVPSTIVSILVRFRQAAKADEILKPAVASPGNVCTTRCTQT